MGATPTGTKQVPRIAGDPAPDLRVDFNLLSDWVRDHAGEWVATFGALPAASVWKGRLVLVIADLTLYASDGTTWSPAVPRVTPGSSRVTPSAVVATGGTQAIAADGSFTFSGAVTSLQITSTVALLSTFKALELYLEYDCATAATVTYQATLAGSPDATNYRTSGTTAAATGSASAYAPGNQASGNQGYAGVRKSHRHHFTIWDLAVNRPTVVKLAGTDVDFGGDPIDVSFSFAHNVGTAFDGLLITLATAGAVSNGSGRLIGIN